MLSFDKPFFKVQLELKNPNRLFEKTLGVKQLAARIKHDYKRYYQPFLWDKNVSAIEQPLGSDLGKEINEYFPHKQLFEQIKKIWPKDEYYMSLCRLFCQNNYNYAGNWHVDCSVQSRFIQCALFTKPQVGFRILDYLKVFADFPKLSKCDVDDIIMLGSNTLGLKVASKYFLEIEGNAGEAVFFEPHFIHQGVSRTARLDFHIRFQRLKDFSEEHSWSVKNNLVKWEDNNYLDVMAPFANSDLGVKLPKHTVGLSEQLLSSAEYFFPQLIKKWNATKDQQQSRGDDKVNLLKEYSKLFDGSEYRCSLFQSV